jgi:hypothetical protein
MPGHSRLKNGVASLACVPGIHVLPMFPRERRGWPGRSPAMTRQPGKLGASLERSMALAPGLRRDDLIEIWFNLIVFADTPRSDAS